MYESYRRFWHWLQTIIHRHPAVHRLDHPPAGYLRRLLLPRRGDRPQRAGRHPGGQCRCSRSSITSPPSACRSTSRVPMASSTMPSCRPSITSPASSRAKPHPFEKRPDSRMNPIQKATYFGILNVLLPLQILTGALMWGVQKLPADRQLVRRAALPGSVPFPGRLDCLPPSSSVMCT